MEDQGKVRVRMDCGKRVLVSLERVGRVQEVVDMEDAEDSKFAQQRHQEEETKGHGQTVDQELQRRKEKKSEEGEKRGQEEKLELWNGVRLVGIRQPDLESQKGVLEEIYKDKVQVLLVGGMHRVKVDKKKVVPRQWNQWRCCPRDWKDKVFLSSLEWVVHSPWTR